MECARGPITPFELDLKESEWARHIKVYIYVCVKIIIATTSCATSQSSVNLSLLHLHVQNATHTRTLSKRHCRRIHPRPLVFR